MLDDLKNQQHAEKTALYCQKAKFETRLRAYVRRTSMKRNLARRQASLDVFNVYVNAVIDLKYLCWTSFKLSLMLILAHSKKESVLPQSFF